MTGPEIGALVTAVVAFLTAAAGYLQSHTARKAAKAAAARLDEHTAQSPASAHGRHEKPA